MLQFDKIMQQLVLMFGCLFPNTSEDEREEAVRQGLVLQSHSTDASRCVGCENTHMTPCSRMGDYLAPYMVLCSFSVDTSICNSSLCELQCGAVRCSAVQCGAVWCSVVQFVVVCCSELQCASIQTLISITTCIFGPINRGTLQHTNNRGTLQHTATSVNTCSCALSLLTLPSPTAACMCCSMAVWCSVVHCLETWCTVVQCGAVWCYVLQCAPIDNPISINTCSRPINRSALQHTATTEAHCNSLQL